MARSIEEEEEEEAYHRDARPSPELQTRALPELWYSSFSSLTAAIVDSASETIINTEQCLLLRTRCSEVVEYSRYWRAFFRQEFSNPSVHKVGSELVFVLNRALQLVRKYQQEEWLYSAIIGQENTAEFEDVLEDITQYVQMINRVIKQCVQGNLEKEKQIKYFIKKVKYDGSTAKSWLKLYSENDKTTLRMRLPHWVRLAGGVRNPSRVPEDHRNLITLLEEWMEMENQIRPISEMGIRYDPDGELGKGGFGTVRKATMFGLPVAVKETSQEREKQELEIMAELHHPQVVQFIGHYSSKGKNFLVMELMQKDLSKLIRERQEKPFTAQESVELMLQIAKGMHYLHRKKIIYRDMKPRNILVNVKSNSTDGSSYFQVKIADFGHSRADFDSRDSMTVLGTIKYMAPEMYGLGQYSLSCDAYSFGITCFEILTGGTPGLERIWTPGIHPTLQSLINECLDHDPNKRPNFEAICERLWGIKEDILTGNYFVSGKSIKLNSVKVSGLSSSSEIEGASSSNSRGIGIRDLRIEGPGLVGKKITATNSRGIGIRDLRIEGPGLVGKKITARWSFTAPYHRCALQWFREKSGETKSLVYEKPIIVDQQEEASYVLNANDLEAKISVYCLPISEDCSAGTRESATLGNLVSCDEELQGKRNQIISSRKFKFVLNPSNTSNCKELHLNSSKYKLTFSIYNSFVEAYSPEMEISLTKSDPNSLRLRSAKGTAYVLEFQDSASCNLAALALRDFKQKVSFSSRSTSTSSTFSASS